MRNDVDVLPAQTELARYEPSQVEALLYAAGRTLMALRVQGCWPGGYRSGMPEYLREEGDKGETEYRVSPPLAAAITAMDRALGWVSRLPARTPAEMRVRKLAGDRMMVSPRTDRPVHSWRRLGARYGISHVWAKTLWIGAVADLTLIANRQISAPCVGTLARIRAAALKPLPPPCADTLRRIQAAVPPVRTAELKAA